MKKISIFLIAVSIIASAVTTVIMGMLFMISIFLPPVVTIVLLFLLIPYALICAIYGFKIVRNKR